MKQVNLHQFLDFLNKNKNLKNNTYKISDNESITEFCDDNKTIQASHTVIKNLYIVTFLINE